MTTLPKVRRTIFCVMLGSVLAVSGCSELSREARKAERDGRVIDNSVMGQLYHKSYRSGDPVYLERDFEAGADFICDEIKLKERRDICSEIGWR